MEHVAIMRKSWGLTEKILDGRKKIESRWYSARRKPWDSIRAGDTVFFKDSGEPVSLKADVAKVLQFEALTPRKVKDLLREYGAEDGLEEKDMEMFYRRFKDKKYCVLVFLKDAMEVSRFYIRKEGFGMMSAWITVDAVSEIKL